MAPVIIIDTREQTPLEFRNLQSIREGLVTGDYSIQGWESAFAVERKSVADLVSCCAGDNRERFEREMHRMRGYGFRRLLIVGTPDEVACHSYRSQIKPQSVLGSLSAWEIRFDLPVVWSGSEAGAAAMIERWASYFIREQEMVWQKVNKMKKQEKETINE